MYGGHGRGWRHRRVYYATGIPGYGRGGCAWRYPAQAPPGTARREPVPELSADEELRMLEEEEEMLKQELEDLSEALEDLKEKEKKEVNK